MSKKAILSSIYAIALATIAGFGINKSVNNNANLSDLALANVEALAQTENNFRPYYVGDYKWIYVGGYITRIPCCKKVTDPHSGCNASDDC